MRTRSTASGARALTLADLCLALGAGTIPAELADGYYLLRKLDILRYCRCRNDYQRPTQPHFSVGRQFVENLTRQRSAS